MVSRPNAPVIVPIGQPLGTIVTDQMEFPVLGIRVGDQPISLPPWPALIWQTAHATAQYRTTGHTRAELIDILRKPLEATDSDISTGIDDLIKLELLVELPLTPAAVMEFATDYRMMALMHGLGNAPDRLDGFAFGLGVDGYSVAGLLESELIWHAASYGSLRELCAEYAPTMGIQPGTGHLRSVEALTQHLVENLAPYLHTNTICIDLALAALDDVDGGSR